MTASGDNGILVTGADGKTVVGKVGPTGNGDTAALCTGADDAQIAVGHGPAPETGDLGFLAIAEDGSPVFLPFFADSNPCDPNPSMLLTVTGFGPATINWCGQTWTLPDDSGLEKVGCPDNYSIGKGTQKYPIPGYTGTFSYTIWHAEHLWQHLGTDGLELRRHYLLSYYPYIGYRLPYTANGNSNYLEVLSANRDQRNFFATWNAGPRPIAPTTTNTAASVLNDILTVPAPTYSDYQIGADFFGSYTTGGVTYSWAQGDDWPV